MDWLRRNWPDLLIGVALVAVIAMIVATLLSGGSLASLVRRDTPPEPPLISTTGPGSAATADAPAPSTTESGASNPVGTSDGLDVFVPGVPGQDETAGSADGETQAGEAQTSDVAPDGGVAATTPSSQAAAQTPLPAASAAGGFRVAAGALDSRDAASATAQGYRDSGFEVTVEQQDDLYLLWVGPYATRADADAAAASIIAGGGDALVYTYDGEDDGDDGAAAADTAAPDGASPDSVDADAEDTGAENADAENTGTAQEDVGETVEPFVPNAENATGGGDGATTLANANTGDAPIQNAAGTGQGQRYLQVGAFATDESAAPLRAQLEGLGLTVTRSEDAGGLVRLFVGPYGAAQLTRTQTRLTAQGIDSFPVVR